MPQGRIQVWWDIHGRSIWLCLSMAFRGSVWKKLQQIQSDESVDMTIHITVSDDNEKHEKHGLTKTCSNAERMLYKKKADRDTLYLHRREACLELLLLPEEHSEHDDSAVDEQTSHYRHDHGGYLNKRAMSENNR